MTAAINLIKDRGANIEQITVVSAFIQPTRRSFLC